MDRHEKGFQTMFLTGGLNAKTRCGKICAAAAPPDGVAARLYADPAKALVMFYLGQLVSDGYAEWSLLDNGDVELRFSKGDIFLLADTSITRTV